MSQTFVTIDNRRVPLEGEVNVLALARKAGIDIPTFCYHSELSVYGACRLCLVEVEGRGIVTSCSTVPENGMVIRTNTREIREMRRINCELLLANHDRECTSCLKSGHCSLQNLARRLGVDEIRFKPTQKSLPVDHSSPSLVRDPNRCILCGDCVRVCDEIQSVGCIDFAYRGSHSEVMPAFGKDLAQVQCVDCGQCSRVCPTGALLPKSEINRVWSFLDQKDKTVVVQVAPAIRVALGEHFGMETGAITTGKIVAALKSLGFHQVYDTSFTADLTVIEEAGEFIGRFSRGEHLPQFTSCCPAWVKFAEQYYPELLSNLSSCKSPQQMFGSLARKVLPALLGIDPAKLVVVSIMPCTAKKAEALRPEFSRDGQPDVDVVLTTQELGRMIEEAGLDFQRLTSESFDLPLGFKTGAGVIFGASGGVTEAVLRYAVEKVNQVKVSPDFTEVRGREGLREVTVELAGKPVKMAVVYGLRNARKLCEEVRAGQSPYALVEVMACPGGCINGAGQPVSYDPQTVERRGQSLYQVDKELQLHKSQDNPYIEEMYRRFLGEVGGHEAHELLHTHYHSRKRISEEGMALLNASAEEPVQVEVCVGTNCYMKGSQDILRRLLEYVQARGLGDQVSVQAAFCFERCGQAPNARIGGEMFGGCTFDSAVAALEKALQKRMVNAKI